MKSIIGIIPLRQIVQGCQPPPPPLASLLGILPFLTQKRRKRTRGFLWEVAAWLGRMAGCSNENGSCEEIRMGFYDCRCAVTGVGLKGADAVLVLLQEDAGRYRPMALGMAGHYNRAGAVD